MQYLCGRLCGCLKTKDEHCNKYVGRCKHKMDMSKQRRREWVQELAKASNPPLKYYTEDDAADKLAEELRKRACSTVYDYDELDHNRRGYKSEDHNLAKWLQQKGFTCPEWDIMEKDKTVENQPTLNKFVTMCHAKVMEPCGAMVYADYKSCFRSTYKCKRIEKEKAKLKCPKDYDGEEHLDFWLAGKQKMDPFQKPDKLCCTRETDEETPSEGGQPDQQKGEDVEGRTKTDKCLYVIDMLYVMVFFGFSAMASTASLRYFGGTTKRKHYDLNYSMSFQAGDQCNDWDLLSGYENLDDMRKKLSFFNKKNIDVLFDDKKGQQCAGTLKDQGFEHLDKDLCQLSEKDWSENQNGELFDLYGNRQFGALSDNQVRDFDFHAWFENQDDLDYECGEINSCSEENVCSNALGSEYWATKRCYSEDCVGTAEGQKLLKELCGCAKPSEYIGQEVDFYRSNYHQSERIYNQFEQLRTTDWKKPSGRASSTTEAATVTINSKQCKRTNIVYPADGGNCDSKFDNEGDECSSDQQGGPFYCSYELGLCAGCSEFEAASSDRRRAATGPKTIIGRQCLADNVVDVGAALGDFNDAVRGHVSSGNCGSANSDNSECAHVRSGFEFPENWSFVRGDLHAFCLEGKCVTCKEWVREAESEDKDEDKDEATGGKTDEATGGKTHRVLTSGPWEDTTIEHPFVAVGSSASTSPGTLASFSCAGADVRNILDIHAEDKEPVLVGGDPAFSTDYVRVERCRRALNSGETKQCGRLKDHLASVADEDWANNHWDRSLDAFCHQQECLYCARGWTVNWIPEPEPERREIEPFHRGVTCSKKKLRNVETYESDVLAELKNKGWVNIRGCKNGGTGAETTGECGHVSNYFTSKKKDDGMDFYAYCRDNKCQTCDGGWTRPDWGEGAVIRGEQCSSADVFDIGAEYGNDRFDDERGWAMRASGEYGCKHMSSQDRECANINNFFGSGENLIGYCTGHKCLACLNGKSRIGSGDNKEATADILKFQKDFLEGGINLKDLDHRARSLSFKDAEDLVSKFPPKGMGNRSFKEYIKHKEREFANLNNMCMSKVASVESLLRKSSKVGSEFEVKKLDVQRLNTMSCVKDWASSTSNNKRNTVFEIYILSLLFHVFLVVDINQFVKKDSWKAVFYVAFAATYLVEFCMFVKFFTSIEEESDFFGRLSYPYIEFEHALKSDAAVDAFLGAVIYVRAVSIFVTLVCVLFGKNENSTKVGDSEVGDSPTAMLYFLLLMGLSTVCATIALASYERTSPSDTEASNAIGAACGSGAYMGASFAEIYANKEQVDWWNGQGHDKETLTETGYIARKEWEEWVIDAWKRPGARWTVEEGHRESKLINCIDFHIYNDIVDYTVMFIVAYTASVLFYVYLLHQIRVEFTTRLSWVGFRIIFLFSYTMEGLFAYKFNKEYQMLKNDTQTTLDLYPESRIITPLVTQVFVCRMFVILCLVLFKCDDNAKAVMKSLKEFKFCGKSGCGNWSKCGKKQPEETKPEV